MGDTSFRLALEETACALRDCYGVYECTSLRLTKVCHFQWRIELYPVCYTVRFISLTSNRDGLTLKFIFISSCAHCKANHKRLVACRLWPSRISELPVDLNHGLVGAFRIYGTLEPFMHMPSTRRPDSPVHRLSFLKTSFMFLPFFELLSGFRLR
jgi:hypothetical protein